MDRVPLGKTGLLASRITLGCVTFGREIDEEASYCVLDHAREKGINLLDTAEAYGGGNARATRKRLDGVDDVREVSGVMHSSEVILGKWLKERRCRDQIILQTKVTPPLNRQRILDSLDASLRRLGTDFVDVFMFHGFDAKTPLQESVEAMDVAVRAGKVRFPGCSNFSAEQVSNAVEIAKSSGAAELAVMQPLYNMAVREVEEALLPKCHELGIGVEAHSPLGAGFLTGKYDPVTRQAPAGSRFDVLPAHKKIYFHEAQFHVVDQLRALSVRVAIPATELAVAWVLQNPLVDVVLIGARTTAHIDNAVRAQAISFDPKWNEILFA